MTGRVKALGLKALFVIGGFIVPFVVMETALRIEHRIRKGTPLLAHPLSNWDPETGWRGKEHRLGPIEARKKILVLGDSFTEGLEVPSEKLWFSSLASAPETQVTAYGGLGYSNLQELMVLKRYLPSYRPDLIVLQLCTNDIINNFRPLEELSMLQRPPAPRPYREGDRIEIGFPRKQGRILLPFVSRSRFLYRLSNKWDMHIAGKAQRREIRSVEMDIEERGFKFQPFRDAVAVTRQILADFKKEAGDVPLIFLMVDDIEPYTTALRDIAKELEIPLMIAPKIKPPPPGARLADGTHFNEIGNEYLGTLLIEFFRNEGI